MPLDGLAFQLLGYLRDCERDDGYIDRHNLLETAVLHPLAGGWMST